MTRVYNTFEEVEAAVLITLTEQLCLLQAGQQLLFDLRHP